MRKKKKAISNAAISALYGAERAVAERKPKHKKVKFSRRHSSHRHNHVRSHGFSGDSNFTLYGLIFAACSLVTVLLYAVS